MRPSSPFARALHWAHGAAVLGLIAACSSPTTPEEPGGGSGGTTGGAGGAMGGTGGATGGAGGAMGGTGGATGGAGGAGGAGGGAAGTGGATGGAAGTGATAGTLANGGGGVGGGAGGAPTGGTAGDASGGTAGTGASSGGAAGAGGGTAGSAGSGSAVWQCPPGVTGQPTLGTLTRVPGVPPADDFNMMNGTFGNIEGPVWTGDALYVSEMTVMPYDQQNNEVKMSRILKVVPGGAVTIEVADSGSNGLAIDGPGSLLATVHKDGTIKRLALPGGAPTPVASTFMNARFNSPNDLTVHSASGTIYFTDPAFNAPNARPQTMERVYRVPRGGMAEPIPSAASPEQFNGPNGITLSPAEDFLYVAAGNGRRYPVMADGSLGAGQDFAATSQSDGMAVDCAGNLYVAKSNTTTVVVYDPAGTMIGTINVPEVQAATNVAFGGADRRTLYVTGLGNTKGLFQMTLNLPGRPY